jgi:hypothetical protein
MTNTISTLKQQLQQLRELHDAGALPASHYGESKALLERRLVDLVMQGAVEETPAAGAGLPAAGSVAHPVTPEAPQKISRALLVALAAGVLVLAGAGGCRVLVERRTGPIRCSLIRSCSRRGLQRGCEPWRRHWRSAPRHRFGADRGDDRETGYQTQGPAQ